MKAIECSTHKEIVLNIAGDLLKIETLALNLIVSNPKNVRRNLVKLQILRNEFSLNTLSGGVEYSLLKESLPVTTLILKVK